MKTKNIYNFVYIIVFNFFLLPCLIFFSCFHQDPSTHSSESLWYGPNLFKLLCSFHHSHRNMEHPSVPRSGNTVPGMGMQERFRPRCIKIHPKCRTTFLLLGPQSCCSGNLVTMVFTISHCTIQYGSTPHVPLPRFIS